MQTNTRTNEPLLRQLAQIRRQKERAKLAEEGFLIDTPEVDEVISAALRHRIVTKIGSLPPQTRSIWGY